MMEVFRHFVCHFKVFFFSGENSYWFTKLVRLHQVSFISEEGAE